MDVLTRREADVARNRGVARAMEKPRITQSKLNIEDKTRSNPLTWKGQFSPQLVEAHLKAYGKPGQRVLDDE